MHWPGNSFLRLTNCGYSRSIQKSQIVNTLNECPLLKCNGDCRQHVSLASSVNLPVDHNAWQIHMKGCPRVSKASTSGREASAMIVARGGCGGVLWLGTAAATSARGEPESLESAHNRSEGSSCAVRAVRRGPRCVGPRTGRAPRTAQVGRTNKFCEPEVLLNHD